MSWVYPPELYPLRVRGKAVALATSSNWAFNTALGAFVPEAFASKISRSTPIYRKSETDCRSHQMAGIHHLRRFQRCHVRPCLLHVPRGTLLPLPQFIWRVRLTRFVQQTSGKNLEDVTEIFENPNGIPYIGVSILSRSEKNVILTTQLQTPAWKTKNVFADTNRVAHGEVPADKTASVEAHSEHEEKV